MKNKLKLLDYPRARIGWGEGCIQKLIEHLGKAEYKELFIYDFATFEIVVLDEKILEILTFLNINYKLKQPSNSIKYIKEVCDEPTS